MLNDNNMGAKLLGLSICLTFTGFVLCIPSLFWASSDLPCKILANFCGSQYLIPSLWCTFQNINWVLLFKTGKIFPKLVHNLAGWFFCFKPTNFRCIHCVLPEYPIPPPSRIIYVDKNGNGHLYRWHRHCTFTHLMSFYPGAPLSTVVWMPGWNCLLLNISLCWMCCFLGLL